MRIWPFIIGVLGFSASAWAITPAMIGAVAGSVISDWFDTAQYDSFWYWTIPAAFGDGIEDMKFSASGGEMWLVDNHGYDIRYVSVVEAFNPATARETPGQSLDISSTCSTDPTSIEFNADNTKFFISDFAINALCQYNMPQANQLNGSVFFSSVGFTGDVTQLRDFVFINSGNELHVLDNDGDIVVYDLSSAYTPSTKVKNTSKSQSFADLYTNMRGFSYRNNGRELVFVDPNFAAEIKKCSLTSAYDPSSRGSCSTIAITSVTGKSDLFIDDTNQRYYTAALTKVATFRGDGLDSGTYSWAQTGTGYTLATGRFKRIAPINSTDIAVNFGANDAGVLKLLRWGGSSWSQIGNNSAANALPVQSGICKLTTNTIAAPDDNTDELEAWAFDGTNWAETGTAVGVNFDQYDMCTDLSDGVIAVLDGNTIQRYTWDGLTFASSGSAYTITDGGSYESISGLSATRLALYNTATNPDSLRILDWNGSSWVQTGNTYSLSSTDLSASYYGSCPVSSQEVAAIIGGTYQIQSYSFDGTNFSLQGFPSLLSEMASWPRECIKMTDTLYAITSYNGTNLYAMTRTTQ